jgi:molybdopterin molybdotransferase
MTSGFHNLSSISDALETFLGSIAPLSGIETVRLEDADERVLAKKIIAPRDLPHYDRSLMDGYAVVASDTSKGAVLKLATGDRVGHGECMHVHTGSQVPEGADAVVMVEQTRLAGDHVEVLAPVSPGQNVGRAGGDVKKGGLVFPEGRQLKPSDVGLLASMGFIDVAVYERPKVLVIPTGEELVPRGREPAAGEMNESNGVMNLLYARRFGAIASVHGIVTDDRKKLASALGEGIGYDLIVTTGGSSVGRRDLIAEVLSSMGKVLVHGVAIKPGKSVALGFVEAEGRRTPIACLPGYPSACAIDSMVFVDPAIKKIGHMQPSSYRVGKAVLACSIFSGHGFRTYMHVAVQDGMATPLWGKNGSIVTAGDREEGYVIMPEDVEGYEAGSIVDVTFLESC